MLHGSKRLLCSLAAFAVTVSLVQPALAGVYYPQDVTAEMSEASYWADLQEGTRDVILTQEEIAAFNQDIAETEGTMVIDLKNADESFDGIAKNQAIQTSATADAKYYFGWTYGGDGQKAEWAYYEKMIQNCMDPHATKNMPVRYGISVNRTVIQVFPSEEPILDDPADPDFDYQAISAVRFNEPLLIYSTSADGKYYLARISSCSGWIAAEDVALCADKAEWLSAWDIPADRRLVVYGNKVYTDASNSAPETARRMLTVGTELELVPDLEPDQLVNNRSPFHNYVVYLPVRRSDGTYEKQMALIPETAKVSEGYLPLTQENIAMVALNNLGDAYGWGGMMDVEDCSGLVRTVYSCFGLKISRNGNWQWNMNIEKVDMTNMSLEEKRLILDELPLGAALCFPGHEMFYLGKVDGKYYVLSAGSSMLSQATGKRLRTRDVMINTLDVRRANGNTWIGDLTKAFMPCYPITDGKVFDFPALRWYHDGIAYCLKNKLMTNHEDGTFGVSETASRAMIVTTLWRLAGSPSVDSGSVFADVAENAWYSDAATWAAAVGIVNGADGLFNPGTSITREQLAAILYRYADVNDFDVSDTGDLSKFTDRGTVSSWAQTATEWAVANGILSGKGGNTLVPKGNASRAEVAQILMNFCTNTAGMVEKT